MLYTRHMFFDGSLFLLIFVTHSLAFCSDAPPKSVAEFFGAMITEDNQCALTSFCTDAQRDYIKHWWYLDQIFPHGKSNRVRSVCFDSTGRHLATGSNE